MAENSCIEPSLDVARDRAAALARVVLHERGDEPLLVAVDLLVVLHQLLVEHVQQRLAGDVGHVVGARRRGAAEGAGAELALGVAVEGDARVLEPQDLARGLPAHDLDRVLVAEVVGALDRVERVRLPGVVGVQRGVDAARGRVGVGADRVDLAHDGDGRAGARRGDRGALAGQAGADDEDVVCGHGGRVYKSYGPYRRPAQRGAGAAPQASDARSRGERRGGRCDARAVGHGAAAASHDQPSTASASHASAITKNTDMTTSSPAAASRRRDCQRSGPCPTAGSPARPTS